MFFRRRPKKVEVKFDLPEELESRVRQVVEAYQAVEEARLNHPITMQGVNSVLAEAELLVMSHLKVRIATVTRSIETLQGKRSRELSQDHPLVAARTGELIKEAEKDLDDLAQQMTRAQEDMKELLDEDKA